MQNMKKFVVTIPKQISDHYERGKQQWKSEQIALYIASLQPEVEECERM